MGASIKSSSDLLTQSMDITPWWPVYTMFNFLDFQLVLHLLSNQVMSVKLLNEKEDQLANLFRIVFYNDVNHRKPLKKFKISGFLWAFYRGGKIILFAKSCLK